MYPFSWFAHTFNYSWVTIETREATSPSYLVSNREGVTMLLYWKASSKEEQLLIAKSVANYCHEKKVKTLTVIDPMLSKSIREARNPFVFSKKYVMNIYSTFDINFRNMDVYDGDGDTIFT